MSAEILSSQLRLVADGARTWVENGAGGAVEGMVQATIEVSATIDAELALVDLNGGSPNGYSARWDGSTLALVRWDAGTPTVLGSDSSVSTSPPDFIQLYVAAGVQEVRYGTGTQSSTNDSVSDTDTTHDAVTKDAVIGLDAGSGETADFDDFLWFPSRYLNVDGLGSGSGRRVQVLNASGAVIASGIESGGEADLDLLMRTSTGSTAARAFVPFGGWNALTVVSPTLVEIARYSSGPVYPGQSYTFS